MPDIPQNPAQILADLAAHAARLRDQALSDTKHLASKHPNLSTSASNLAHAADHLHQLAARPPSPPPTDNR